jgi:prepilin-type N-terminal cleavage/methylation domain-containing protein/prepilin-type processing-associated H-X9-DG protein
MIRSKRKAFTLIELLVVIAIIALLLSVIMPALKKAKDYAKNLMCSSNLRGIITAWHVYSGDNGEKLCSAETRYNTPTNERPYWVWNPTIVGTSVQVTWVDADSYNPTQEEREEGLKRGLLWPYLDSVDVFHCPSDKSKGGNFRSYSMPDSMNGSGWFIKTYKIYRKQGEIVNPAGRIVMLEENDWRGCNFGSFIMDPTIVQWGDPMTVWHSGTSSFAFADGHAEFRNWDYETVKNFTKDPPEGGYVPTTPGGIEDVKWMHKGWSPSIRE